ncbi:guanitoxin biosynthesis MBL fold metallo-hydrolase GntH [Aliiruegeria lutimaris]|uniref:Ribonuclease Z n=1 Tax=Aliiruegeria lutimaris TaxID=571298 RepID=A0A1G8XQW5_9RHOB|nr:guanitoxin biosynthesis MBL fold metallo-hydrolase GntH [Aliiruegeria lutimaris]SDJ92948.1 ribonuclease Z [Aliiruegeria lutimaris]
MRERDPNFFYPGEPLLEDEMRITALGTGMPFCRRDQKSAGWLVELGNGDKFIFDLGTGSSANLNALGVPHSLLDKVFLTHLHVDHMGDLTSLYGLGMVRGRFTPLRVWGPSSNEERLGTAAFGRAFEALMAWDIESRRNVVSAGDGWKTEFTEFDYAVNGHVVFEENGVSISAFPAIHCIDGPVSYRLDWNGLSFVFLGDGKPSRFLVENAQGADVLIHEAFLPAKHYAEKTHLPLQIAQNICHGVHCPPRSAGKMFTLCQPRLGVLYHTMISEDLRVPVLDDLRTEWKGPVALAEDLMVLNVSRQSITQRQAVVPDLAWPVPSHRSSQKRPRMDTEKIANMSQWLKDAEIPVDGVETFIEDDAG